MGTGLRPRAKGWVKERQHAKFQGSQLTQILSVFGACAASPPATCQWHASLPRPSLRVPEEDAGIFPGGKNSRPQTLTVALCSIPTGLLSSFIMNWHMAISVLTVVALKIVRMTLFLLYCEYLSNLLPQPHTVLSFGSFLRR